MKPLAVDYGHLLRQRPAGIHCCVHGKRIGRIRSAAKRLAGDIDVFAPGLGGGRHGRCNRHVTAHPRRGVGYTLVIDAVALLALRNGDRDRAARLSAAVASLERTSGTGLNQWNREVLGFFPAELKADPALADSWAAGEAMTADEAVAYALAAGD